MGKILESFSIFDNYLNLPFNPEDENIVKFNDVTNLLIEFYVTLGVQNESSETDEVDVKEDDKVLNKTLLFTSEHSRPYLYNILDYFGFGIEFICSQICFYKAKNLNDYLLKSNTISDKTESNDKSKVDNKNSIKIIIKYLSIALEYIEFSLKCVATSYNLIFSNLKSLIHKSNILSLLSSVDPSNKNKYTSESKEALLKCISIGKKYHFNCVILIAWKLLDNLNVDTIYGKNFQFKIIEKIKLLSENSNEIFEYNCNEIYSILDKVNV